MSINYTVLLPVTRGTLSKLKLKYHLPILYKIFDIKVLI